MGKRKSARKPQAKVRLTLDRQFTCLFCNHEKAIDCKLCVLIVFFGFEHTDFFIV